MPKPTVPRRVAVEVEGIRVLPAAGVAVRGGEADQALLALGHDVPTHDHVTFRGAEEHLHRRLQAHRLVECEPHQRRVRAQPRPRRGGAGQARQQRADAVHGGVHPAVSSERTTSGACAGVMSPRSDAAQIAAPNPSSASTSRAHCPATQPESSATRSAPFARSALSGPNALNAVSP